MIHPEEPQVAKPPTSGVSMRTKLLVAFYLITLHISLINFVPMLIGSNSYAWRDNTSDSLWIVLVISSLMTLPLIAEFLLDVVVTNFYSVNELQLVEHRFGQVLLLVSLCLPGLMTQFASNLLLDACIISICQSFAVISIYGTLLASSISKWDFLQSLATSIVFIASQLGMLFSFVHCDMNDCQVDPVNIKVSLFLTALCLVMHLFYSRKAFWDVISAHMENKALGWTTNDVVSIVFLTILFVYFVVNIVLLAGCLRRSTTVDYILMVKAIKQLVLGFTAIIIPGRIIRNNFIQIRRDMENKETFMRYITHEIRGPLSTTNLGLDYLKEKLAGKSTMSQSDILEVVTEMKVTCDLAASTLNDLLMFDKIESDMLEVTKADHNICKFVSTTVSQYHMQAVANELDLQCILPDLSIIEGAIAESGEVESSPPRSEVEQEVICSVDIHKMEQVLRNLLNNAMKFTPGGGSIKVVISTQKGFTQTTAPVLKASPVSKYRLDRMNAMPVVRIEVSDTGPGISKENLPRLFGQYVQFDADKLQGGMGSGLGLWLSKAIVERHGGKISATSEGVDKGCTFSVELPCILRTAATSSRPAPSIKLLRKKSISQPKLAVTTSNNALESGKTEIYKFEPRRNSTGSVDECSLSFIRVNSEDTYESSNRMSRTFRPKYQPSLSPKGLGADLDFREDHDKEHENSSNSSSNNNNMADNRSPNNSVRRVSNVEVPVSNDQLKVLVVDDSAIARKMVGRLLAGFCSLVQYACNGQDAVEKVVLARANNEPFDIILMDYYMPIMNGPEAISVIRDGGYSGLIIGLSATDTEFEPYVGRGVDQVMMKPFNIDTFQTIINDMRINAAQQMTQQ